MADEDGLFKETENEMKKAKEKIEEEKKPEVKASVEIDFGEENTEEKKPEEKKPEEDKSVVKEEKPIVKSSFAEKEVKGDDLDSLFGN